jgi:hypothetical protein
MKTRHKIPAVFSIYMVDVLCCALGCVILLWQLYHQDSEEQTAKNEEIRAQLGTTDAKLEHANKILAAAEAMIAHLRLDVKNLDTRNTATAAELAEKIRAHADLLGKLTDAEKKIRVLNTDLAHQEADTRKAMQLALVRKQEYEDMKKTLAGAEAMIGMLRLDLKTLERKNTLTAAELADKIRAHADLFDKLADAERKIRALTTDLAFKEGDNQVMYKRVEEKSTLLKLLEQELQLLRSQNKDTLAKLSSGETRSRLLEEELARGKKELVDVNRRNTELSQFRDDLSKRVTISVKDLETAKTALAMLERDKVSLLKKATAAEQRFAGIALTGKRVIFLVDMSGSMEMVDDTTFDPDKWPIVCDTVASIMRSLPDLRAYQVIVFSDRFKYAFGNEGRWVEYNPEISPKKVAEGLKAIKPKGGTDMYAAFQEVFRYRDVGLDTVYFFSDGLPNLGEGLPANTSKLTEEQRGEVLGKHIRGRLKNNWNRPLPNQARVRINCIGFFFESPDLGAFLWALAREHDGSFVGMSRP